MKPRTQVIVLGVLLVVLAGVAMFTVGPLKPKGRATALSAAPAAAAAPAIATTATPAAPARPMALPTRADLVDLAGWLAAQPTTPREEGSVLGLAASASAPRAENGPSVGGGPAGPAPQLEGILRLGEAGKALFHGRAYAPGQRVEGTGYCVAAVGHNTVTLRGDNGQSVMLDLVR